MSSDCSLNNAARVSRSTVVRASKASASPQRVKNTVDGHQQVRANRPSPAHREADIIIDRYFIDGVSKITQSAKACRGIPSQHALAYVRRSLHRSPKHRFRNPVKPKIVGVSAVESWKPGKNARYRFFFSRLNCSCKPGIKKMSLWANVLEKESK